MRNPSLVLSTAVAVGVGVELDPSYDSEHIKNDSLLSKTNLSNVNRKIISPGINLSVQ